LRTTFQGGWQRPSDLRLAERRTGSLALPKVTEEKTCKRGRETFNSTTSKNSSMKKGVAALEERKKIESACRKEWREHKFVGDQVRDGAGTGTKGMR